MLQASSYPILDSGYPLRDTISCSVVLLWLTRPTQTPLSSKADQLIAVTTEANDLLNILTYYDAC